MTLADLLSRRPTFVHLTDAGMNLGGLYAAIADWRHAADAYSGVATNAEDSDVAASARWSAIDAHFARGDIAGVLYDARTIAIKNPRSPQAVHAMELGFDAVLLNSAVAQAHDPVSMARAFKLGIEAGRLAWEAGVMARQEMAVATTPVTGRPFLL